MSLSNALLASGAREYIRNHRKEVKALQEAFGWTDDQLLNQVKEVVRAKMSAVNDAADKADRGPGTGPHIADLERISKPLEKQPDPTDLQGQVLDIVAGSSRPPSMLEIYNHLLRRGAVKEVPDKQRTARVANILVAMQKHGWVERKGPRGKLTVHVTDLGQSVLAANPIRENQAETDERGQVPGRAQRSDEDGRRQRLWAFWANTPRFLLGDAMRVYAGKEVPSMAGGKQNPEYPRFLRAVQGLLDDFLDEKGLEAATFHTKRGRGYHFHAPGEPAPMTTDDPALGDKPPEIEVIADYIMSLGERPHSLDAVKRHFTDNPPPRRISGTTKGNPVYQLWKDRVAKARGFLAEKHGALFEQVGQGPTVSYKPKQRPYENHSGNSHLGHGRHGGRIGSAIEGWDAG